mmetsp:Transcript_12548/g.20280  ORF Transcript_12548/g.20280 Transcript_12548/m.20280 type:complete len:241 (+) Transcript_12548:37-759(+)
MSDVAELEKGVKNLSVAPEKPGPCPESAKELLVYQDDAALGQKLASISSLKFHNGDAFDVGQGKVCVMTFFCNLNKSDYVTLSVLSDIYQKYKDQANFVAVSRDHSDEDTAKWLKKYNGKFMAEQKGPNGEAGVTSRCDFQMAFDEDHKVNNELKTIMKKATVGVGMTIIFDKEGKIAWYEQYSRGVNATGQFEYQLHAIVNGTELLSNGDAPEIVEEEVEGGGAVPDDIDFLGGGGGDY